MGFVPKILGMVPKNNIDKNQLTILKFEELGDVLSPNPQKPKKFDTKSVKKGVLQKAFTKVGMKEILVSKANNNIMSLNDDSVCMSRIETSIG